MKNNKKIVYRKEYIHIDHDQVCIMNVGYEDGVPVTWDIERTLYRSSPVSPEDAKIIVARRGRQNFSTDEEKVKIIDLLPSYVFYKKPIKFSLGEDELDS